ncbi:beta-2-glycoprotein 1-like isoform X2 [Triplophysa dalaica]|uniref:beta-2-glycoprotein 1-like isoform X2 n=1 Tax=Triplophysa dalaica TaxID=1582913 RepID=UPI0024DFED1D|nr:beta-2-glycoprotein 1-like isoform X2 [Triplophysa dalaica]
MFALIWHQWNWVKGLFFYSPFKTLNMIQMCVFSRVPWLHSSLTITVPPPLDSPPSLYSPFLSCNHFHNICSEWLVEMESSLLFYLLCVWALSCPSIASVEAMEQCPERILGNERRRACPKKCLLDEECGSKRQCLCDGQCGLSCVAPGRSCPWPLPPGKHCDVALLSPSPSFSALLEVRCKSGYTMPNGLDVIIRRCQASQNGGRAEVPDRVLVASCSLPDNDLLSVQGNAAVGSSIKYQCESGYVLVGHSQNICRENQTWQYPHPVCRRVFCPPPKEVDRGHLVAVQRVEYEVGNTIYYLCKKTFFLDGPNKVTCLPNGTWSAVPACRARCPVPAQRSRVIVGGEKRWPYDLTDGVVAHGENVTFFCQHPEKQCSFTATEVCVDGQLMEPSCYLDPTWLQFKLFPHRLVSEIDACDPADLQ